MNYIYDILLNFQKDFYDFFEWNPEDEILHIRKIPLFKVSNKDFTIFKKGNVRFESNFMSRIYNRTEKFKKINTSALNYVFLVSNGKEAMGLKLNKSGIITHRSSLLIDEDDEIADMANDLKIWDFEYTILSPIKEDEFQTRFEKENGHAIIQKLNNLYNHKEDEKLKFLYLECFSEKENDVNKIFSILKEEILKHTDNYNKIFDFFKIIGQK